MLYDVFEKFIDVCLKDYGLDPYHYCSSPGLSWEAMLEMTGIRLEKINNIDVHLSLEKGMRGGISYISKSYSKSDENTNIMYWDANNLYGWAKIQDLPNEGFKFLSEEESKNSKIGYILEVDLEYCKELHNIHNGYPLCPEHIEVGYKMLSKYCKDTVDRHGIKVGCVKKLIPNFYDKVRYVVYYKNLLYYLSLGTKLINDKRKYLKIVNWPDFVSKKK